MLQTLKFLSTDMIPQGENSTPDFWLMDCSQNTNGLTIFYQVTFRLCILDVYETNEWLPSSNYHMYMQIFQNLKKSTI
jgi:hypothetical protein